MLALVLAFFVLALVGHAAFWVGVVNRWHSVGLRRVVVKSVTLLFYVALVGIPLVGLAYVLRFGLPSPDDLTWKFDAVTAYLTFCAAYGAVHIPMWAMERWRARRLPANVRAQAHRVVDIAQAVGSSPARGPRARFFCRLPYNQLWKMHVEEFLVDVPGLPAALDGVSICHWADLHVSGRIDRGYYREVVRLTNDMRPDLIALSGDICDKAACIDWLGDLFAPAESRLGKYFILGNHDLRTRAVDRVRTVMCEAGFTDVGSRKCVTFDGQIMIEGNERPWFKSPVTEAEQPPAARADAVKILLSHSPDRFDWAQQQGFNLMLAGHTHGGQIRMPVVGAIFCPSRHGTKFARGFFWQPPTLLHVSRGTGSLLPLRINCPPELTKLVLRRVNPA